MSHPSYTHASYTHENWGDSWLLMAKSQIANLTFGLSFGHNLCFNGLNGSCKPILDMYVPRAFQWYKELLNPMGFDPCNCSLKIQESTKTLTPKVGVHLGVWGFIPSHSLALPGAWNVTFELHTWLAPSQAFALVSSPRLGLRHTRLLKNLHKILLLPFSKLYKVSSWRFKNCCKSFTNC